MNKDWVGNSKSVYYAIGASNHTEKERAADDYYATDSRAIDYLLEKATLDQNLWECACGEGHLSKRLIEHALELIPEQNKVFMFLKLTFLEGKSRRKLFETKQLKTVYVSSSRIKCAPNGDFEKVTSSAVAYAWFEFQKGYHADPQIVWIN